jgi:tRNA threonylcarbamoyladenosine biosynthesis protein TsaE
MDEIYKIDQLPTIAKKIIEHCKDIKNVLFYAEMGAGKTTLIKEIIKQLGVTDNVSSPTFSLVNEYISNNNETIYHFDFYRIEIEEEVLDIGIEDYFYKNAWCFIEWPQNIESYLPENSIVIEIEILDEETREIKFPS